MPMVGMATFFVTRFASAAGIDSSTIAKAPASSSASASSKMRSASASVLPTARKPPELMDRLRDQPDVSHHRDPDLHQPAHGVEDGPAALQFDGRRAALLHQAPGIANRVGNTGLVRKKRHVGHHQGAPRAADHRARMVDHRFERHRHRGVVAHDDHPD